MHPLAKTQAISVCKAEKPGKRTRFVVDAGGEGLE
jgi:hypothetical protein